jgi:hypothetical protein
MIGVQVISYVVAVVYLATMIYVAFIWNRDDRK